MTRGGRLPGLQHAEVLNWGHLRQPTSGDSLPGPTHRVAHRRQIGFRQVGRSSMRFTTLLVPSHKGPPTTRPPAPKPRNAPCARTSKAHYKFPSASRPPAVPRAKGLREKPTDLLGDPGSLHQPRLRRETVTLAQVFQQAREHRSAPTGFFRQPQPKNCRSRRTFADFGFGPLRDLRKRLRAGGGGDLRTNSPSTPTSLRRPALESDPKAGT